MVGGVVHPEEIAVNEDDRPKYPPPQSIQQWVLRTKPGCFVMLGMTLGPLILCGLLMLLPLDVRRGILIALMCVAGLWMLFGTVLGIGALCQWLWERRGYLLAFIGEAFFFWRDLSGSTGPKPSRGGGTRRTPDSHQDQRPSR